MKAKNNLLFYIEDNAAILALQLMVFLLASVNCSEKGSMNLIQSLGLSKANSLRTKSTGSEVGEYLQNIKSNINSSRPWKMPPFWIPKKGNQL